MYELEGLQRLMQEAIAVAARGVEAHQSPFGAVIADNQGTVVCVAHNTVRETNDPTAHAEVNAIRTACRRLNTIDLSGHLLVSTCEPCPMCASAIHWSRLDAVACGATIADAVSAGFNELHVDCASLYKTGGSAVAIYDNVLRANCRRLFQEWQSGPNPNPY